MHVPPVFLNRGQYEDNADGQEHATNELEPQLAQCSEKVAKDDFELATHDGLERYAGLKRAQKQSLAYHLGTLTKAAKL